MNLIMIVSSLTLLLILIIPTQASNSHEYNFDAKEYKIFTALTGKWEIIKDETSPSMPSILAQIAENLTSAFNVVLFNKTNYKDLDVSVKMKAVSGKVDQGGGIIWRAKDINNYYIARYNPLEDNFRVYKVENGNRKLFKSANVEHRNDWYTLRIRMENNHMECFLDGTKYLEHKDDTFDKPGKVGLWTKADAKTFFDDLIINKI